MTDKFNWDDYLPNDDEDDNNEDDMFGTTPEPWVERQMEIEKAMLFSELRRGIPIPLSPQDWDEMWELTTEDMNTMTQAWIRHFMRESDSNRGKWNIINTYRNEWLSQLLHHNEEQEEYELCSLINELLLWSNKQRPWKKLSDAMIEK
jgi:hypothetical protein